MQITITIETGNAAFQEDTCGPEVARILRKAAARIEDLTEDDFNDNGELFRLHDINGNRVGEVTITDADDEPEIRQTACKTCGQDIEGEIGGADWRDRGGNTECPPYEGDDREIITPKPGTLHTPTED